MAMSVSNILLFFWLVLPLIFAILVFIPVMTAVIITTLRRKKKQQNASVLSDIPEAAADEPKAEEIVEISPPPDMIPEKSFAEILREHRISRHISQEYVAEQLDVTRQAVSKWENGTSEPSTANLIALAKLYGISLDELVRGTK